MKNTDIRAEAAKHDVRLWQIADSLGIHESCLSRKMRSELTGQEKTEIQAAIARIKNGERLRD